MVIDDLDIFRTRGRPAETQAKLPVDPHTPPSGTIAFECFQPIGRWRTHVINRARQIQLLQFAQCRPLDIDEATHAAQIEQGLGIVVTK